ncbi:hypothetical protein SFRURICE_004597 [Spodoptera frugiperda]|nr:hypothetical protein SFRURICE_004597 [Spodoptera frugiperda]
MGGHQPPLASSPPYIYTDWANHYLERARSRRRAGASGGGLARDCADGLLLADVLEGVTGLKVHRAHRKPRNPQQMVSDHSLTLLVGIKA